MLRKQTKGQVHFGFNKYPSLGHVSLSLSLWTEGRGSVCRCCSACTEEGRPSFTRCQEEGWVSLGGGTLQCYPGLAQTVSPENISRVECDAGMNVTLTNLLQWFNKTHFAPETLLRVASGLHTTGSAAALWLTRGCRGLRPGRQRQKLGLRVPPASTGRRPAESWVF